MSSSTAQPPPPSSSSSSSSRDELLVFGYACKLFRDDAKAEFIDGGGGLVPWMGDDHHPIDRYDGRGHLHNLSAFETPIGGFNRREQILSADEIEMDDMCDVERYRALKMDEFDHLAEEEEIEKRAASNPNAGAEIGFNYDANPPAAPVEQAQPVAAEPISVQTMANCIEKTAEFIATHGAQMEILMRTKEANNPKFQFLDAGNPYNSIYRQVLAKKRSRPKGFVPNASLIHQASLEVEKSVQRLQATLPSAAPNVGGIPSAPVTLSADNAFSKLVERIRAQNPTPPQSKESTPTPPTAGTPTPPPPDPASVVEVIPPPITMQPVIDRTASYVARKGSDSLPMLKKFEPEKFSFLNPTDRHHQFFQYKIALYREMFAEKEREKQEFGPRNGAAAKGPQTEEEKQREGAQVVTSKFPTLKGFFN